LNRPFDAARYAGLLEGLEVSEMSLSAVLANNSVFRFDADYFGKSVLVAMDRLIALGAVRLASVASITDGIHESLPFIEDGPVKVLSAKHPKDNYIHAVGFETISQTYHDKNPRTALRNGDVLLSTVGTIGNAAVVTEDILPANSDRHIGIIRPTSTDVSPYYTSTFLTTKYGRMQSLREATGNVQLNLFISKIGQLLLPRFSARFESRVASQVVSSYNVRKQAAVHMAKASQSLLNELGLENWQPLQPLSYVRKSREAFVAARLDAEHFKPMYFQIEQQVRETNSFAFLGDLLAVNLRGTQPEYAEFGLPVINSRHVASGEVCIDDDTRLGVESKNALTIRHGDVLINGTGVGTIGRAAPYLRSHHALPDNHVTILRPKPASIDSVYLSVLLNSLVGQQQVSKWLHGSSGQIELYPSDIAQFIVWIAPDAIQQSIRKTVEAGLDARAHALELLDAAKRAVEIAIEDSEAAALAYLADANARAFPSAPA
jgi:type I restriction enzyme M protein